MTAAGLAEDVHSFEGRRRIVVTTLGSRGDLHPFLAVARGLQARGHDVVVATGQSFREKIEALGLGFAGVRPGCDFVNDPEIVGRIRSWGLERVIREVLLPVLRQTYEDTLAATDGADLLFAMQGNYAGRLVAEKRNIRWVSGVHFPLGLFSAHDPPVLPSFPEISQRLHSLGPPFWKPVKYFAKQAAKLWAKPWHRLRAEIGLPRDWNVSPLVNAHSPLLHLALFSKLLSAPQPDWPAQTLITGFPRYDQDDEPVPAELAQFMDEGPPPIVFSLGTVIAKDRGERDFFEQSVTATKSLGHRAVLILGEPQNRPRLLPDGVIAINYFPFPALLARAGAIVHHGGIGSTGLAMRSGRPTLVVPCAWDQPDNAARLVRMGIARTIPRRKYNAARAAAELRPLLDNPTYSRRSAAVGETVRQENGEQVACDALLGLFRPAFEQFAHQFVR